jgi:hypothetical protein
VPDLAGRAVHENIGRFDVLVNRPVLVQRAECGCEPRCKAQELHHLHWSLKESIKRLAARVLEDERRLSKVLGQSHEPNRPCRVQLLPQLI